MSKEQDPAIEIWGEMDYNKTEHMVVFGDGVKRPIADGESCFAGFSFVERMTGVVR